MTYMFETFLTDPGANCDNVICVPTGRDQFAPGSKPSKCRIQGLPFFPVNNNVFTRAFLIKTSLRS